MKNKIVILGILIVIVVVVVVLVNLLNKPDSPEKINSGEVIIYNPTTDVLLSNYRLRLNTDGLGEVTYANIGKQVKFDEEFPVQSVIETFKEPTKVVIAARPGEGWKFIKWTKAGADYSKDIQVEVEITSDMEFRAVFEPENNDLFDDIEE